MTHPLHHYEAEGPSWKTAAINGPVDVYVEMAWTAQAREFPGFFCECHGYSEEMKDKLFPLISFMLKFALVAAGADNDWEAVYSETLEKMGGAK